MIINTEFDKSKDWTLFLDRDGTLNKRLMDDYVKLIDEFEFLPGVLEALTALRGFCKYQIVVTNQQGIGKEIMSHEDLQVVHAHMLDRITEEGGFIDEIYYCPHLAISDATCRKPNPGMAFQALEKYGDIEFKESIMVGDTESDITFGRNLGMYTVLISNSTNPDNFFGADMVVSKLLDLANFLLLN